MVFLRKKEVQNSPGFMLKPNLQYLAINSHYCFRKFTVYYLTIQNAEVTSQVRLDEFIFYGDGIIDANFFMGNLVTEDIDKISVNTLSSYTEKMNPFHK